MIDGYKHQQLRKLKKEEPDIAEEKPRSGPLTLSDATNTNLGPLLLGNNNSFLKLAPKHFEGMSFASLTIF